MINVVFVEELPVLLGRIAVAAAFGWDAAIPKQAALAELLAYNLANAA